MLDVEDECGSVTRHVVNPDPDRPFGKYPCEIWFGTVLSAIDAMFASFFYWVVRLVHVEREKPCIRLCLDCTIEILFDVGPSGGRPPHD